MESSELVFDNKDGNITAAGYKIDSLMLNSGQPIAVLGGGGGVIESLKLGELAVPLGLFYLQDLAKKSSDSFNTSVFELYDDESSPVELIQDSLYDKLLSLVDVPNTNKKNKFTRKKRTSRSASKKTRVKGRSTSLG